MQWTLWVGWVTKIHIDFIFFNVKHKCFIFWKKKTTDDRNWANTFEMESGSDSTISMKGRYDLGGVGAFDGGT